MKTPMVSLMHKLISMKNVQFLFQRSSYDMTLNIFFQTKYVFFAVVSCSATVYAMVNIPYPRAVIRNA